MNKFFARCSSFFWNAPTKFDAGILIVFLVLITLNPFYLNDRINLFELGLYLPGINAIQHGLVPYRDFFHLRGPLELYIPVLLMQVFGTGINVLCAYFFFGNVLCLAFVILIARELVRSRYILYMMVPVVIARAYPRVTYMIWGGMRYAFGLIALFCLIKFLKSKKLGWIITAGVISACAGLVSVEMGAYCVFGTVLCFIAAFIFRYMAAQELIKAFVAFMLALGITALPWVIYSIMQHAFIPYLDMLWTIVTKMQVIIDPHLVSIYPNNFSEAFTAMTHVTSVNFKHMTPAYTYVFLVILLAWKIYKKAWGVRELSLLALGVYGFIMYNTGFRGLWASQFEMALMPEKIIYFILIESMILWFWQQRNKFQVWQRRVLIVVVSVLFISSILYAIQRYNNRFWSYQYLTQSLKKHKKIGDLRFKDKNQHYQELTIDRARGIWVPDDQYQELNQIQAFIKGHSKPDDTFVMFPELGIYHFLFDRPFLGRFPITTFSWFNDRWFEEYMEEFSGGQSKYMIVQKKMPDDWLKVYLGYEPNRMKYTEMLTVISQDFKVIGQTQMCWIYERK